MAYLIKTKKANINGELVKGFPILLWENNDIHWLSLNFFIEKYRNTVVKSIGTYAQHLQDIYSQIEYQEGIEEISDIDDDFLIAYKASIRSRGITSERKTENTKNYAAQIIGTVLLYCMWLEENGYSRNLIGTTKFHKIRITLTATGRIKHALSKHKSTDKKALRAPRESWVEIVKRYGPKGQYVNKRFELMVDWGRAAGLRADENCHLTVNQLPLRETAEKGILDGKNIYILLTHTKGSIDKSIPVNPLLIKRTWDFIDAERAALVQKIKIKIKNKKEIYTENDFVFLSERSGDPLLPSSFSREIRTGFLKAVDAGDLTEDERVWCHGLKHIFSVVLLKRLDEKGVRRPEAVARQATRHSSEGAMEPYLTERFNEDF
jgi:site-specific recombinase XerD